MEMPVQAFERELLTLLPRLRRFARSLARDAADADDLSQVALERALKAKDQWQQGTRLDAWMYRIMRNCCPATESAPPFPEVSSQSWTGSVEPARTRSTAPRAPPIESVPRHGGWRRTAPDGCAIWCVPILKSWK